MVGVGSLAFTTSGEDVGGSKVLLNSSVNGFSGWQLVDMVVDRANGTTTAFANGTEYDVGSGSAFDFGSTEEGYLWIGARTDVSNQLTSASGATTEPLLDDQRVLFLGFRAGEITLNQHRNDAEKIGLWSPS